MQLIGASLVVEKCFQFVSKGYLEQIMVIKQIMLNIMCGISSLIHANFGCELCSTWEQYRHFGKVIQTSSENFYVQVHVIFQEEK